MYKDVITYKLAEHITKDHLINVAKDVMDNWMSKQEGFVKWTLHQNNDGSFTDIVYWTSKENAKKAEADMANIPDGAAWFDCYEKGSISSQNLEQIESFEI